jgi:hypothetical protein
MAPERRVLVERILCWVDIFCCYSLVKSWIVAGRVTQVVAHLPGKHESLCSSPSTEKERKKHKQQLDFL